MLPPVVDDPASSERALQRGDRVGRYLVLDEIGAGGMGVVYRAYDPELDRKVALKVLRSRPGHEGADVARARLQREAQTLARVSHPHVVRVFDVGTHHGRVFVAMALVEGCDLAHWIGHAPRTWREVVAVVLAAGRGLVAAHEQGLVHRDFKPSNVLVADDGGVAVTDFGLARTDPTSQIRTPSSAHARRPSRSVCAAIEASAASLAIGSGHGPDLGELPLTQRGRTVGTPAYMAPEQHAGDLADARADQYALCITLYEALYGVRPFAGHSHRELAAAKREGLVHAPPTRDRAGTAVPMHVRRVLRRGLAAQPQRRFPTLGALLAELAPAPRRGRSVAAAAAVVALTVLGGYAVAGADGDARAWPCADPGERFAGVWDASTRARTRGAFEATALPYASPAAAKVVEIVDGRVADWIDVHADVCAATWIRAEQSQRALDLRMGCLAEQREAIVATARLLAHADVSVVDNAASMALALPKAEQCADVARLAALAPPSEGGHRVAVARRSLLEIGALRRAGHLQRAHDAMGILMASSDDIAHAPTRADLWLMRGMLQDDRGEFEPAAASLREAALAARSSTYARGEAAAWIELMRVIGSHQHQEQAGRFYAELALSTIATLPSATTLRAWALSELGELELRTGHDDAAREALEQALTLYEETEGPDHLHVAETLLRLAATHFRRGATDVARQQLTRATEIYSATLGSSHPRVAAPRGNLGLVLAAEGDLDGALVELRAGLTILERAHGSEHPGVATAHDTIGEVLARKGHAEAAATEFRRAIAIFEATLGAEHPAIAAPLLGLGRTELVAGRVQAARSLLERAYAMTSTVSLPPEQVSQTALALADALQTVDPSRATRLRLDAAGPRPGLE